MLRTLLAGIFTIWLTSAIAGNSPDIIVAADGSGDFKTVQDAVSSIAKTNRERKVIFVKKGIYHEKVRVDASFLTLMGDGRDKTRIEFPQGADEFTKNPDNIGRAVANINGDDVVLQNLTVKNTQGVIGPHAFAVYGQGDKTVITDCNIFSDGADTLAIWSRTNGGSYLARLNIRGSVDFVCPRGWCYMTDCSLYQVNPQANAAIWHDGSKDRDMKFVIRDCKFDGAGNWILARHHHDAQFYLLDCKFTRSMRDFPPKRVIYPLENDKPSPADAEKNRNLDASNIWGERNYFYDCHRNGGDYAWFADNLSSAPGSPKPEQITASWTFAGKWNPENKDGPKIIGVKREGEEIVITFSENVTVKGRPQLKLSGKIVADYVSGSGTNKLIFAAPQNDGTKVSALRLNGGSIIACEASVKIRSADLSLPR